MTLFSNTDRRGFMAHAFAGSAVTMLLSAPARAAATAPSDFGPLKHVRTSLLDIAYGEVGPADGKPVLLVHGWPYDIYTYADAARALGAQGYRVLVPYLRGYGAKRFSAVVQDRPITDTWRAMPIFSRNCRSWLTTSRPPS